MPGSSEAKLKTAKSTIQEVMEMKFDAPVPSVSTQPDSNPEVMTPPPTPLPPTPSVNVGPIRFEFEDPPSISSQEETVPPLKDHIIEALKKRIFELENESRDLKLYTDTFKKLFRPDSILKATGQRKRVNWSNKTMEESLHDKVVLGSTGYDHLQSKFPGMYPCKTTQNKTLRENMNVPFGIIEDSFKLLEITAKKKHSKQRYISLIMDEMAIKELVEYDPSLKCLTGAITMPLGDDATIDDGKINPIAIFVKFILLHKDQCLIKTATFVVHCIFSFWVENSLFSVINLVSLMGQKSKGKK